MTMGSCVSHCSRQDVVHHQTGSVINTNLPKSIGFSSGTVIQKTSGEIENQGPVTNEFCDQINAEIHALRDQLVRSQVLFTYLLKSSSSEKNKTIDEKKDFGGILEGGVLADSMFPWKSFDGQALARLCNRSNRSSSSFTSHRSTPLHYGYTSLSCPTLPIDYPVITQSTQTDPVPNSTFYANNLTVKSDSLQSLNKKVKAASSPSISCDFTAKPGSSSDICDIHQNADDRTSRNRTNSFISAISEGNSQVVDANVPDMKSSLREPFKAYANTQTFCSTNCNYDRPELSELKGKCTSQEMKENILPRKLSILMEEDHEDGNLLSFRKSRSVINRKMKSYNSSTVNTQTDLSVSHKHFFPQTTPAKESRLPKLSCAIISQSVSKRTVFSTELGALRHPPPYTKKYFRRRKSGDSSFHNPLQKWATVGDSLARRSDRRDLNMKTRHLSLEKQESFSSCDQSLCTDSLSSVPDSSGWITKSDLSLKPPSYLETIQRSQFSRNRWACRCRYVTHVIFLKYYYSEKTRLEKTSSVKNSDIKKDKRDLKKHKTLNEFRLNIKFQVTIF